MGAAGLFLLATAVTLIVLAASHRRQPAAPAPEPPAVSAEALGIQDFLLEAPEAPGRPEVYLFRQPTPRWSEEQVKRYWVPVREGVLGILRRENDRRTEELLREVP
jgi:hypothetical protein